jgi:hypothetical protein
MNKNGTEALTYIGCSTHSDVAAAQGLLFLN